ncbi:hypothetical protein ACQR16_07410 [Bradyrhizobium oligotrophicum]|uniref:hypothetical protein n=1 Tax=Bradyrhizobium oligotrophicum TaxID=44255 RepID=UPI003EBACAB4
MIYFLTVDLLRDKRKHDVTSPSSFYALDEIVSSVWFRAIGVFFAGTISLTFAAVAFDAAACLSALKQVLLDLVKDHLPVKVHQGFISISAAIPPWAEPLIVLSAFLFLFASKIRSLLVYARDLVLNTTGLYSVIDENAKEAARALLQLHGGDFDRLETQLQHSLGSEAPLPPEFVGNKGENRVAYQLIWRCRSQIRADGLINSLDFLRQRLGVSPSSEGGLKFDLRRLIAAPILFSALLGLYVIFVPLLRRVVPLHFEWPNPDRDGWFSTIRYVLKFTASFVLPLAFALHAFPVRRRAFRRTETHETSFAVMATSQLIISLAVQELFNGIDVAVAAWSSQDYSFLSPRLHISALLYSMVPIIAFGAILWLRSLGASRSIIVGGTTALIAVSFGFCDFVYECHLPAFYHYYLYQALLGSFISMSFFAAGAIME